MVKIAQITQQKLIPILPTIPSYSTRNISKYINPDVSSKYIRKRFMDYFIQENNHKFVRSSPVVPYCDPTVPFVNAGMNQFKGIFLGTQQPKHMTVANYQKCIRVGGKHNDLTVVGADGYHHTFFEMLGNWSFGEYFKPEACKLAWDLLTQVYKLPEKRLYVTYFEGDETLGLQEDTETKEIWKNLGVRGDRIIPFGMKDNFWEMGLVGPCGPCSEIHYDHIGRSNRAPFVNKGLHDLVEIWNIVFIEYNRLADGSITKLPKKHVDTGMGFERITSVMQGKISNYDTDIFRYLIKAINKNCRGVSMYEGTFGERDWNELDRSYRILADHMRMITVSLGDGVIPEENQKLRRIMRKTFLLCENIFKKPQGLVKELTNYVIDNLGPAYPELEKNILQIQQVIDYEEEIYKSIRQSASKEWETITKSNPKLLELDILETPNFIKAYKEISSDPPNEVDSKLAFKLYDTHGLDEDSISKLASALNIPFAVDSLSNELEIVKIKSKRNSTTSENEIYCTLLKEGIPITDDHFKYSYVKKEDKYAFDNVAAKVLKIFRNNKSIDEVEKDHYCSLVLDKTNFYSEAGGQIGDKGFITFKEGIFQVTSVENLNGFILHNGFLKSKSDKLKCNCDGMLEVDQEFRENIMRNHTSTHLLNATLKHLKAATCQKSSKVTDKYLNFDVAIFGDKLSNQDLDKLENKILNIIKKGEPVNISEVDSQDLLGFDTVTLIPGEIYPESGIRIVEVKNNSFLSREPCCGTHVLNTSDINEFCFTHLKSLGRSTTSLTAVTGERAKYAKKYGVELLEEIERLTKQVDDNIDKRDVLNIMIAAMKKKLNYHPDDSFILPLTTKIKCMEKLESVSKKIDSIETETLTDFIEMEIKNALDSQIKTTKSNHKYLVHYLRSSTMLENVPLQKATRLCPDYPILVIAYAASTVKARCCVPESVKTDNFTAEKWMNEIATVFKSKAAPPKGQDGTLVCNMKAKRVNVQEWDPLLKDSIHRAQKYIEDNL